MVNFDNVMYTAPICVGNPPQKLMAAFDTGSTNTWVLSGEAVPGSETKTAGPWRTLGVP